MESQRVQETAYAQGMKSDYSADRLVEHGPTITGRDRDRVQDIDPITMVAMEEQRLRSTIDVLAERREGLLMGRSNLSEQLQQVELAIEAHTSALRGIQEPYQRPQPGVVSNSPPRY